MIMKKYIRVLWWTVTTYILTRQRISSFVLLPYSSTQRQSSSHGYTNTFFLMQHQLNPLRRNTSISSSTNSNQISDNDPTKRSMEQRRMGELTKSEQLAYDILCELSKSKYSFRIVVVGKIGSAILESTVPCFGPQMKILQSPSTGANMATFANADQSFEYHVQLEQICKVAFVVKETPKKTLRIVRLMNDSNDSITSFILVDASDDAQKWFDDLIQRYGNIVQL